MEATKRKRRNGWRQNTENVRRAREGCLMLAAVGVGETDETSVSDAIANLMHALASRGKLDQDAIGDVVHRAIRAFDDEFPGAFGED